MIRRAHCAPDFFTRTSCEPVHLRPARLAVSSSHLIHRRPRDFMSQAAMPALPEFAARHLPLARATSLQSWSDLSGAPTCAPDFLRARAIPGSPRSRGFQAGKQPEWMRKWIGFLCLGVTAFGWALNWPLMKMLLQQWQSSDQRRDELSAHGSRVISGLSYKTAFSNELLTSIFPL
jgi:hypothetical protein